MGFVYGSAGKESACQCRRHGSIGGSGRSPVVGNGTPLQYSCLGNPTERVAWWATVHGITESRTELSMHTHTYKRIYKSMTDSVCCTIDTSTTL